MREWRDPSPLQLRRRLRPFHPLVPLAGALAEERHEVAFATAESFRPRVEEAGFELLPAGIGQHELEPQFAREVAAALASS